MRPILYGSLACFLLLSSAGRASEATTGRLLIVGGNLRPENAAIYNRLVEYAGGRDQGRIAIVPTASRSTQSAQRLAELLPRYGFNPQHIEIIDLTVENSAKQSSSPEVIEQIRKCTAVFFTGGDQQRIMQALLTAQGEETPLLKAMRAVWARGGVIAGSSAGAAVQCDPMISVSGLPDEALDEGMDALDFGVVKNPCCRGLLLTRGLGFFRGGLVDQHFSQFRGRLARLSRACIEQRVRYGFGVDENTAMAVRPDGTIEVVGPGNLTIVDAQGATCLDSPLGCKLTGVRVSILEQGDSFDPRTGNAVVHASKRPIAPGTESFDGNHLMPDIAGHGAATYALKMGLADNTSRKQVGVTLRYNANYGHGYRLTLAEDDRTRCYAGYVDSWYSYAILNARLDVEPIVATLQSPATATPVDLPQDDTRKAIEATVFRGLLLVDQQRRFRPQDPITRAELAGAMAHTLRLLPARKSPTMSDVPPGSPWAEEIAELVAADLMQVNGRGEFRPAQPVPRQEAAAMLVRLYGIYRGEQLASEPVQSDVATTSPSPHSATVALVRAGVLTPQDAKLGPTAALTRQQAAAALYRVIGFPW